MLRLLRQQRKYLCSVDFLVCGDRGGHPVQKRKVVPHCAFHQPETLPGGLLQILLHLFSQAGAHIGIKLQKKACYANHCAARNHNRPQNDLLFAVHALSPLTIGFAGRHL